MPALSAQAVRLSGSVSMECSANVVRFTGVSPKLFLSTNGHCIPYLLNSTLSARSSLLVIENLLFSNREGRRSSTTVSIYNEENLLIETRATVIHFATMYHSDVALIELSLTEEEARAKKIRVLEVAQEEPRVGEEVDILSGFWGESLRCRVDRTEVHVLEDIYEWPRTISLTKQCPIRPGFSGSAIISKSSGQIIGVANSIALEGKPCQLNSPCEKTQAGLLVYKHNMAYGQRLQDFYGCFDEDGNFNLNLPSCVLERRGLTPLN